MNYYDDLGVAPDATQAEIRAAYRLAARVHHPDRQGGNPEAMARANRANDVLSDPVRRKRYDETGADGAGHSLEDMARALLRSAFDGALDSGAPLAHVRMRIRSTADTIRKKRGETGRTVDTLRAKLGLVLVADGGENIFAEQIASRAAALERDMAMAAEAIHVHEIALEMLKGYSSSEPTPKPAAVTLNAYAYGAVPGAAVL